LLCSLLLLAVAGCSSESDNLSARSSGSNTQASGLSCNSNSNAADGARWMSAWGVTHVTGTAPVETTVRNIARVTASGNAVRMPPFRPKPNRFTAIRLRSK